jgi:hypothetical protein
MNGEKTKLLWQNPEYRKHMSEVHMGHKKPANAYSFPKGKDNPDYNPEVVEKIRQSKIGDKNGMFGDGTYIQSGYRKVLTGIRKYTQEHRLVMEEYLGRKLEKEEVVHHIDGDRSNNNIDNLMLFKNVGEHTSYHHKLRGQVVLV